MCGICGFVGRADDFAQRDHVLSAIKKMSDSMLHRGPDGAGQWLDMEYHIALGHRRLSIIDLSEKAGQPMISGSGRYVISCNGEIYNFLQLKEELLHRNVVFRTECDTEVFLECIDQYGIDTALEKCIGMFGAAIYDRQENKLHLVRDRLGEKSIYYGWNNGRFLFGSELKALKAFEGFKPELDTDSVYLYLKYRYIKAPWSIYKGICKLLPGEIVTLDIQSGELSKHIYYSLEDVIRKGEHSLIFDASLEECADHLEKILTDVISDQLRADVAVGLFLSSGIDSALTSSIAQRVFHRKLKTYSIGSHDDKLNEAVMAKEYAKILGTDHHEYYIDEKMFLEMTLRIPAMYDEPFAQPSAIPTFLVSQLARKDVTVALSGDGGDELFAGYMRDIAHPVSRDCSETAKALRGKHFRARYDK